jgi:hypothetical protein
MMSICKNAVRRFDDRPMGPPLTGRWTMRVMVLAKATDGMSIGEPTPEMIEAFAAMVRVIDDYGEATSVAVIGATIYIHPLSVIQKRLTNREKVIVEQLCNDSLSHLGGLVEKGNYSAR